ncbi:MAG: gliding motility-associated C-terminal domain-containing protein [Bacteroidaceae bacterium]|nr:gliding motility-associated C-terminal domain-containing protein [Bacteroidaceae bacterium]
MQTILLPLRWLVFLAAFWAVGTTVCAQDPTCAPTATFTYLSAVEPTAEEAESYSGSAPVKAEFHANPSGVEDSDGNTLYVARYEWKIYDQLKPDVILVHRFQQDMEYTFQKSGSFIVELNATFVQGNDTIYYPAEGETGGSFTVSIAESILEMPNGFSPNGDDINDIYKAKDGHQSIVSFRASIFNRWGQRLYSWSDINGGWDGKVNGHVVPDGVYFVNVVAKGADGHEFHIRKDVNVLTRIVSEGTTTGGEE